MRSSIALLAFALATGTAACGRGGPRSKSRTPVAALARSAAAHTPSGASQTAGDNDGDGDGGGDDNLWSHAATPADRRAVVALVTRYYALAAAGRGAAACSLLYAIFAEEVPERYGESPSEPALHGKTCPAIVSKLFELRHSQLAMDVASLKVIGVRVRGPRGLALLSFKGMPEHDIPVHREGRGWKVEALLDDRLG